MDPGTDDDRLSFATFDLNVVMTRGAPLLASSGGEFDAQMAGLDARERMAHQKRMLKRLLGMETEMAGGKISLCLR